jgi:hypothetical protein
MVSEFYAYKIYQWLLHQEVRICWDKICNKVVNDDCGAQFIPAEVQHTMDGA